jgi:hypothetical protein
LRPPGTHGRMHQRKPRHPEHLIDEAVTLLATRSLVAAIVQFPADEGPHGLLVAQEPPISASDGNS